ncbi:MAG: hypothetical protein GXO92_01395 [FCB group bacterium]|nr:hypothetical protein [FCB group bacterium]
MQSGVFNPGKTSNLARLICTGLLYFFGLAAFGLAEIPVQVKLSRPGTLILEVSIDSIWFDQNNHIRSFPVLPEYQKPGFPVLPVISEVLVGVPATATIQIFSGKTRKISAITPVIAGVEAAKGINFQKPVTEWSGGKFPSKPVFLHSTKSIDPQQASVIKIFPVRYENNHLQWTNRLTIRLTWEAIDRVFIPRLLSRTRLKDLNPQRRERAKGFNHSIPAYQFSENIARITLDTTGWYALTKSELADSGLSLRGVDPRTFRLWNREKEILLFIEGEEDGSFDTGDRIIFYGERNPAPEGAPYRNNFYTAENVYWLTWGAERGLRYLPESAYPDRPPDQVFRPTTYAYSEHIERDEYFDRLGSMGLHRQWDTFDHFFMTPPVHAGTAVDFEIVLPNPEISNTLDFKVQLEIQGITASTHKIQFLFNDRLIGNASWTGQQSFRLNGGQGQDYLRPGKNTVTILNLENADQSNRYDQVYLNWIEVTFNRQYAAYEDEIVFTRDGKLPVITQFEVSGFSSPRIYIFKAGVSRLQDFIVVRDTRDQTYTAVLQDYISGEAPEYHAFEESKLRTVAHITPADPLEPNLPSGGKSYVIIAPDSFRTVLEPLAVYHNGVIIDVEDIYRQYSGGVTTPYAIKSFLTDAYRNWTPRPEAVLIALQGKWFGFGGGAGPAGDFIPAMKIQTVGFGAVASDFWFANVEGDDLVPEFAIGRFPARNREELETMVAKTLTYLTRDFQSWENNVLMIGGYETTFKDQSETLIRRIIEQDYFPTRLYIDKYSEGGVFFGNTDSLLAYFNRGVSYVNFFGHGGGAVWGDRSLFTLEDLESLANGTKQPFVTSMTCFTGDVTNPNALGRRMMSFENGGAVAWFGSAGVGWIINDYLLLQPLQRLIFSEREMGIGEMINQAKIEFLAANDDFPDIAVSQVYQFNLTGDPALVLRRPLPTELTVVPADPEPGTALQLTLAYSGVDSLTLAIYDDRLFPVDRRWIPDGGGPSITYEMPDTLNPGRHRINVAYKKQGSLYRSGAAMTVSGSLVQIMEVSPARPTAADSIRVRTRAQDRQGIDSVQLWVNGSFRSNMIGVGDHEFELETPLPPQPPGSIISLQSRVVDGQGNVAFSPEKQVKIAQLPDMKPVDMRFVVDERISLQAGVQNLTGGAGEVTVEFQREVSGAWKSLGVDSLYFTGKGKSSAAVSGAFPVGIQTYRVITTADEPLSDRNNDTLIAVLETPAFWVTPELGTTENLSSHGIVGLGGVGLEIPSGTVSASFVITLRNLQVAAPITQPEFVPDTLDPRRLGLEIVSDTGDEYTVSWTVPNGVTEQTRLFRFYDEFDTWLPVEMRILSDSLLRFTGSGSGKYAFFVSGDVVPPRIEATVNGQRFLHDGYVSASPLIALTVQDHNGIDHRSPSIDIWINNREAGKEIISQVNGKPNILGVQLSPTFTVMDSTLAVVVHDATGNPSDTLRLEFIVREKLDLIDYGNYPNPFKDQTRFAYELTETVDEFSLEIYTVAGRRIRNFTTASTLTDLDPRAGAYHEIIWDGRSANGDFVANGVYFYRMKARKGKTVIERRGKVAKAR